MEGEQKIRVLIFSPLIYEYFLINSDRFMMKFISCLISERVSEMKNVVQKSRNVKSFFYLNCRQKSFSCSLLSTTIINSISLSLSSIVLSYQHRRGIFFLHIFCTHFFASNLILSSSSSYCCSLHSTSSFQMMIFISQMLFFSACCCC